MSVESKLLEASRILGEAEAESGCSWCSGNIKAARGIIEDLAEIVPFTEETARRVRDSTASELRSLGGKVGALRKVVTESKADNPGNGENINIKLGYNWGRGIPMAGVDKKTAMKVVGTELLFGAGVGIVLNRVDEYWVGSRTAAGQTTAFYEKLSPWINLFGGLGAVVIGTMGVGLKNPDYQMMAVVGGGAMITNAILNLGEGLYQTMMAGTAARPGAKAYLPMQSRAPSQIAPRLIEISSF